MNLDTTNELLSSHKRNAASNPIMDPGDFQIGCQPSTINTRDQKIPPSDSLRHFGCSTSLTNCRKFTTPPENLRMAFHASHRNYSRVLAGNQFFELLSSHEWHTIPKGLDFQSSILFIAVKVGIGSVFLGPQPFPHCTLYADVKAPK